MRIYPILLFNSLILIAVLLSNRVVISQGQTDYTKADNYLPDVQL